MLTTGLQHACNLPADGQVLRHGAGGKGRLLAGRGPQTSATRLSSCRSPSDVESRPNCEFRNPISLLKARPTGYSAGNLMNSDQGRPIEILLVEDSPSDTELTLEALRDFRVRNNVSVVEDGVLALEFLHQQGPYTEAPRPDLIMLDLNLLRTD